MKKIHEKIGAIVREYRSEAGMTQLELSIRLGHNTPQFVSLFERGLSKVPYETIGQLISILGIPEKVILEALVKSYEHDVKSRINLGKKSVSEL